MPDPSTFLVTFVLKPGAEAEFLELLSPVLDAMRHEAGFINAILHRDPADPARFMLYESWRDRQEVIEVEIGRPYRSAFWARLPGLLAEERRIEEWRPLRSDLALFYRS